MVHRGEIVTPAGGRGPGGGLVVNVYTGAVIGSEKELIRKVRDGLARDGRSG